MLIERLQVKGLLSFGPEGIDLTLEPLNVLIGPNGSGKSNLLQVLALLRVTGSHRHNFLSGSGEWKDLVWEGPPDIDHDAQARATVVAVATPRQLEEPVAYLLEIGPPGADGNITRESVKRVFKSGEIGILPHSDISPDYFHRQFGRMRLYRDWTFGAFAPMRDGQAPAQPLSMNSKEILSSTRDRQGAGLSENADNLASVISQFSIGRRDRLARYLDRFYEGVSGINTPFYDGKLWVAIEEHGGRQISAARLSDGTLRYLCLLTILLDPEPPPLIGIEEPELGLHPDVICDLAELLVEASERTQLIVTTHSPTLIDALTDHPSSVVTCEKYDGQTRFRRVKPEALESWIGDQGLGEVWAAGGIGGNRW